MQCSKCRESVRPVVALDIDGTLADYHRHFLEFAYQWLGHRSCGSKELDYDGSVDLATWLEIDKRMYRECKLAYRQGGMKRSMPIYPGAWRLTNDLRLEGVEVWLTTTRPYLRLDNIDPDTREWCRRHDIRFDGLLYDEDKYGCLAEIVGRERILAVLDDDLEQVQQAMIHELPAAWRRNKYNRNQPNACWDLNLAEYDSLMEFKDAALRTVKEWRCRYAAAQ